MRLYLLPGGAIDADRSVTFPGDDSRKRVTLPVSQVLIQAGDKTILVDTGMPVIAAGDSAALEREYGMETSWIKPLMSADQQVDIQLGLLGLKPADLDLVINTHFHFDHAGANALFTDVTVAAQQAELEEAQTSDDYLPIWDAPGLQFRAVQCDWSPVEDVEMLLTPGHTPGHQSMLVRLPDGPWLFTFDAVYTEEHWRRDRLGTAHDVTAARASMQRLKEIAVRENARIIFGHDQGQWSSLGMGGARVPKLLAES